jgi:hypothetical protein
MAVTAGIAVRHLRSQFGGLSRGSTSESCQTTTASASIPQPPIREHGIVCTCRRQKIDDTEQSTTKKKNLPFDPSSWATGRVGNFAARRVIFVVCPSTSAIWSHTHAESAMRASPHELDVVVSRR